MKSILFVLSGSTLYLFLHSVFLFSDIVIGQGITGIVTVIVAYIAYRTSIKVNKVVNDVQKLDVKVDGRLTQLLEATTSDQRQKGMTEGQEKVKAEGVALASDLDKQTETILEAVRGGHLDKQTEAIIAAVKERQQTQIDKNTKDITLLSKEVTEQEPAPVVVVKNLDK